MTASNLSLSPKRVQFYTQQRARANAGFSLIELMIVVAVIAIMTAIAIPSIMNTLRTYRTVGDARSIAGELQLARLKAGADLARAEVVFGTDPSGSVAPYGSYHIEIKGKNDAAFVPDGGATNPNQQHLSGTVSFSLGNIAVGAGQGCTQATPCASPTQASAIVFNSRGIPIDPVSGSPTPYAVYLAGTPGLNYAVTADLSGKITVWSYDYGSSSWITAK